jgi:small subunit ribosomal protein S3
MGIIGIKVWIFRGELERGQWSPPNVKISSERQGGEEGQGGGRRPDRRPDRGDRGDRGGRKPKKQG